MQRRILIVDDSALILSALRAAFEKLGHVVDTAVSLEELEGHRERTSPDIILLDVQMPEAWGDDIATTLRGAYGVSVPIMLMSSIEPEELAQRASDAGVAWISKRGGLGAVVERAAQILSTGAAESGAPQ